ncbi:hypothetical protein PA10_00048 [Pseudomonas phage pPa_SNUABM_DT01]|nr:hypothetical protein PA10_00048 [Pseudomonas phage pPa_SNUABM_DT01]
MSYYTYQLNPGAESAVKAVTHDGKRGTVEAGLWVDYEVAGDTMVVKAIASGILPPVTITRFTSFNRLAQGDQGVIAVVAKSLNMKKIKVGSDTVHLVDSAAESDKVFSKIKRDSALKTLGVLAGVAVVIGVGSWLSNRNN